MPNNNNKKTKNMLVFHDGMEKRREIPLLVAQELTGKSAATIQRTAKRNPKPEWWRVIDLYAKGYMVPLEWQKKGFYFDRRGHLCGQFGDGLTWSALDHFSQAYGLLRLAQRENKHLREYCAYQEKLIPRADVIPFPNFHRERNQVNPYFRKPPEVG